MIRNNTRPNLNNTGTGYIFGRPTGSPAFIVDRERHPGRYLTRQPAGRKPKEWGNT